VCFQGKNAAKSASPGINFGREETLNRLMPLVGGVLILYLFAAPSAVCQSARSKSDADINAIGRRNISQGPNVYSPEREKELGNKMASEVEKSEKFITDTEIIAYVHKVATKVEQNSDKHMGITVKLIDSEESKAFTLPGGHQYLTKGLLIRLQNEGELASAIAHEVAHTALRSSTRIATKSMTIQLGTPNSPAAGLPLLNLKETHDSEFDADFFGVQYVYKAGYNTQCFLDFVELTGDRNKGVPANLNSFPPVTQRLQSLEKEIAEMLPKRDGAVVSTTEFQEFKDRLQGLKPAIVPSEPTQKNN